MFSDFLLADIRRSNRPFLEDKTDDDYFQIDVLIAQSFFILEHFIPVRIAWKYGFMVLKCRLRSAVGSQRQ